MLLAAQTHILENPNENGIGIFVLGVFFVLSIYHFSLYFQHKDKVYLYYSLYTFLIFFSHLVVISSSPFIDAIVDPYRDLWEKLRIPLIWLYNSIYFIFIFTFLNLRKYSEKWYQFIFRTIYIVLVLILLVSLATILTGNMSIITSFEKIIIPFFFFFGIICYYPMFTLKMPLKYYIIVGSLILYIFSLIAYYIHSLGVISDQSDLSFSIFYTGVMIENIVFSLGLGQKQKFILQEKNESQNKLIQQLEENKELKNKIQEQLESDVLHLSKEASTAKIEKIKAKYDKDIETLKMTSLRSQMNPHFIFNSLNAIKLYIIDNDKENAVYYLNKFSKLIRKILDATREKEITLSEEIETIKLYIDIENIRFNNEIELVFTVDENLSLDTIKIPSLILQPFVENAIWHGLSLKKEKKKLHIDIQKKGKTHIEITIEDNGIGRKKSALIKKKKVYKKDSIGINLTKERLSNFEKDYTNNYSLKFEDLYDSNKESIGTRVDIKIPIH